MRFVTISKKGAARRVPGQSPRRAEARGVCSVCTGVGRGRRGRFGIRRHSQAPCRIEQQLNRARLQLCFEPSLSPQCLTRPSPLTVSPRLRTVLPSFRAIQPAGGHTRVLLCPKTTTTRPRHASSPALHRSPCYCCCRRYLLCVFRLLALRVNPPHLGGEELAASARICDRLHHSNRPAPDRVPGFA